MIPANELRIGNWVYSETLMDYGRLTEVHELYAMVEVNGGTIRTDKIQPIPLTPELLEKAGFKQSEDFDWEWTKPVSVNGKLVILLPKNWQTDPNYVLSASWQGKDEKALLWTRLKHLHQLQNYVFAVTEGQELEIKL